MKRTCPVRLPTVEHRKKKWFVDARLMELRNVKNPHERIEIRDVSGNLMNKILKKVPPTCLNF